MAAREHNEDLYGLLVDAQNASKAGDFIYIFPGDGTTTGMDSGIVMKANQTLAGSGNSLQVETSNGNILIPQITPTRPTITNTGGMELL